MITSCEIQEIFGQLKHVVIEQTSDDPPLTGRGLVSGLFLFLVRTPLLEPISYTEKKTVCNIRNSLIRQLNFEDFEREIPVGLCIPSIYSGL